MEILKIVLQAIGVSTPLLIAFIFYRDFEIKKNIINKQLQTVFDLITELHNKAFDVTDKGEKQWASINQLIRLSKDEKQIQRIYDREIYIDPTQFYMYHIWDYHDNPFLPIPIAESLKVFKKRYEKDVRISAKELNLTLDVSIGENHNMVWALSFAKDIENVKQEIKKWLKSKKFKDLNY